MTVSTAAAARARRWAGSCGVDVSDSALERLAARLTIRRRIRVVTAAALVTACVVFVWRTPALTESAVFAWSMAGVAAAALAADALTGAWRALAERRVKPREPIRVARATRLGLVDTLGRGNASTAAAAVVGWILVAIVASAVLPVSIAAAWVAVVVAAIAHVAVAVRRLTTARSASASPEEVLTDDALRVADVRDHVATSLAAPAGCGGVIAGALSVEPGAGPAVVLIVACLGLALVTVARLGLRPGIRAGSR